MSTNGKGHYYTTTLNPDEWYPGVTTILGMIAKPMLIPWAAKEAAKKIKAYLIEHATGRKLTSEEIDKLVEEGRTAHVKRVEEAADLGSRAHKAIDDILEGREPVITQDIKAPIDAFLKFKEDTKMEFLLGDTKIASLINRYGGSLDALGWMKDKFVIVDLKTSSGCWPEMGYQVAAYARAFAETYGLPYLPEGYILRLGKIKPEFEWKKIKSIPMCFDAFLSALRLYELSKNEVYE